MTTPVVIFGAGGHAREVQDALAAANDQAPGTWDVLGFLSEVRDDWGKTPNGVRVLGGFEWFEGARARRDARVICAIGNPAVRRRIAERCESLGLAFATVVHPRATLTRWVELGAGSYLAAGVVLTNQIRLGRHVHLNVNSTVAHDGVLGDYVTLAPGVHLAGNVTLGEGCDVGIGAAILPKRSVGEWSVVGAGAVVTRDLPANVTAVGVPARVIAVRAADPARV